MNAPVRTNGPVFILKSRIAPFYGKWCEIVAIDGHKRPLSMLGQDFRNQFGLSILVDGAACRGVLSLKTVAGTVTLIVKPMETPEQTAAYLIGAAAFITFTSVMDGDLVPFINGLNMVIADSEDEATEIWDALPDCDCDCAA